MLGNSPAAINLDKILKREGMEKQKSKVSTIISDYNREMRVLLKRFRGQEKILLKRIINYITEDYLSRVDKNNLNKEVVTHTKNIICMQKRLYQRKVEDNNLLELEKYSKRMHDIWTNWFLYQREHLTEENLKRWNIQASTKYSDLSEEDKEKDRKIVKKFLNIS